MNKWKDRAYWTDEVLLKELHEAEDRLHAEEERQQNWSRLHRMLIALSKQGSILSSKRETVRILSAEAARRGLIQTGKAAEA